MFPVILKLISVFNAYAAKNQFVAGALSLWGLGVISYLCKDVPRKIWGLITKFSTTTLTVTSSNDIFYLFLKWYELKGYASRGRYVKFSNGRWGDGDLIKSLGYGTHYFWYKWRFFILTLTQKESTNMDRDKDELTMVMFGRSHEIFNLIFDEVYELKEKDSSFVIKRYEDSWWRKSSEQRPRNFDTIFLRKGIKEKLMDHFDKFNSMEQWYLDKGIPYQTGILLYGPPGTGKTSVIKAIAHYLDYQIHILGASSLASIESAMFNLPEKSLICIEDIDTNSATKDRQILENKPIIKKNNCNKEMTTEDEAVEKENDPRKMIIDFSFSNLSDILNAIDGVQTNHGRILILTTNDISKLDSALIRPGRIDLILEIGYVDVFILRQFFNKFYPTFIEIPEYFKIKDGVSSAVVQNLILENLNNPLKVLDHLREGG